jgi:hypothetical protein
MEIIDDLLWFDITIHADRDSFGRETFVRFIFCNGRGDTIVCQGIWFKLKCNLILPRSSELIRADKTIDTDLCSVFPNPVSELLEVRFNNPSDAEISVGLVDIFGKYVHLERIPPQFEGTKIDVNSFTPGIYFLVIIQDSKIAETHKVAVMRY